jgi:hypothetical protein
MYGKSNFSNKQISERDRMNKATKKIKVLRVDGNFNAITN